MPEEKEHLEKLLQVREFGDSLYVPLTKHLKAIGTKKNQIVKVCLRGDDEIVITRPDSEN